MIELTADGADYQSLGDFCPDAFDQGWEVLHGVLEDATQQLTRRQLLKHWPPDFPAPDETTLWRWLDRAVRDGRVLRDGTGRKNAPFRYRLPAKAEAWQKLPFHPDNLEMWFKPRVPEFVADESGE